MSFTSEDVRRMPGFVELVEAASVFPLRKLKQRPEEIWLELAKARLIEHNDSGAENSYIIDLLEPKLKRSQASRTDWSTRTQPFLRKELRSVTIGKTMVSGAAHKERVIKNITANLANINETYCQLDSFFTAHDQEVRALAHAPEPKHAEMAVMIVAEVEGMGPFRSLYGLSRAGIGLHLLPDIKHNRDFLRDDLRVTTFASAPAWRTKTRATFSSKLSSMGDFPMMSTLREFSSAVMRETPKKVHLQHVGWAIHYYKVMCALVRRKYRPRVSPSSIIDFLKDERWSIEDLDGRLWDVDRVDDLARAYETFLDGYPGTTL